MGIGIWQKLVAKIRDPKGSASMEFVGIGLILLVPLFYIAIAVASVQSGSLAAQNAARAAARVFVEESDMASAVTSANKQALHAFSNFGLESAPYELTYICETDPCLYPESAVEVTIKVQVSLPLAPSFFGMDALTAIERIGTAVYQVPRY